MTTPLVIVGSGGFGRETLDVVEALNRSAPTAVYEILGVVDSHPAHDSLERLRRRGICFLGSVSNWLDGARSSDYLLGVGNPFNRARLDSRFRAAGMSAATAIHPTATVGSEVQVSDGVVICAGAQVSTNVALGRHVHLNPSCTVGHDTTLHNFVSINPGAIISGDVRVEEGALIGAGAVVIQGLTIGEGSTIGAAACVVRNVDANTTVKGVPAR